MGKSKAPTPPDPRETAAAQTGTNVNTAKANSYLGMVDQVTPYGTLTYERIGGPDPSSVPGIETISGPGPSSNDFGTFGQQGFDGDNIREQGVPITTGTNTSGGASYRVGDQSFSNYGDAEAYRNSLLEGDGGTTLYDDYTGQSYNVPRFRAITELSPEQQKILESNQDAQQSLARLAAERSEFLEDYLPGTEALTDKISGELYDMGRLRLDPRFAEQEEQLRTRLANQGIGIGTEAYDREMRNFEESRNDAYTNLMLSGRGQALNEINTPINQITALLSGSQVTNPNVQMQQPAQIPTTDVAGIINTNYQQQLQAAQLDSSNSQRLFGNTLRLGGLFGSFF
ncbi:MAG: hypothetical protein AAFQ04_08270 [Pseudomonadota bacterium]